MPEDNQSGGKGYQRIKAADPYRLTCKRMLLGHVAPKISIAAMPRLNVKKDWFMAAMITDPSPTSDARLKSGEDKAQSLFRARKGSGLCPASTRISNNSAAIIHFVDLLKAILKTLCCR